MKVTFSDLEFTVVDIGADLPNDPGCYVFMKKRTPPSDGWTPIYFGETGDLSERFDSHHAMPCIMRNGATHIGVLMPDALKDESLRRSLEEHLIDENPTPCNKT